MFTVPNTLSRSRNRSNNSQKLLKSFKFDSFQLENLLAQKSDIFNNALLISLAKANAERINKYRLEVGRGKVIWAYYTTIDGKKRATFISPKEFQGYQWIGDDCSIVVNMQSGAIYEVSDRFCSCPSWEHHVKTGQKRACKHQTMRREELLRCASQVQHKVNLSDSLPAAPQKEVPTELQPQAKVKPKSKLYEVKPKILDPGLSVKRTDDYTQVEYKLKAWCKENPDSAPIQKTLGTIIETDEGFQVSAGILIKTVSYQADAVDWLLRRNGMSYADILAAYKESQNPQIDYRKCPECGTIHHSEGILLLACSNCGWVKPKLTFREQRRLARQNRQTQKPAAQIDVIQAFGGFF